MKVLRLVKVLKYFGYFVLSGAVGMGVMNILLFLIDDMKLGYRTHFDVHRLLVSVVAGALFAMLLFLLGVAGIVAQFFLFQYSDRQSRALAAAETAAPRRWRKRRAAGFRFTVKKAR